MMRATWGMRPSGERNGRLRGSRLLIRVFRVGQISSEAMSFVGWPAKA
jgi:hypothetical protein